jgi:hypothetical protein
MPWVEFEPTIQAFERAKTFHALDRAATVIGVYNILNQILHFLTNGKRGDLLNKLYYTLFSLGAV